MTPLAEPVDNDPRWGGKECHVVLAHLGSHTGAGHWLAFVKRSNTWWKVDTDAEHPVQENPFLGQAGQGDSDSYTLDILGFASLAQS